MENASKALIITAGMLITILILTLAAYIFSTMGKYSDRTTAIIEANSVNKFNNDYLIYDRRNDLTIQDVITIVNTANNSNNNYGLETADKSNFYVTVNIIDNNGTSILNAEKKVVDEGTNWLKDNLLSKYSCEVMINETTSRVNKISLTKL